MGSSSSSTATPTVTELSEDPYISLSSTGISESRNPKMALTFDSQALQMDDGSQDTLMGLQELDAIFEKSADAAAHALSTSDSPSDMASETSHIAIDVIPSIHIDGASYQNSDLSNSISKMEGTSQSNDALAWKLKSSISTLRAQDISNGVGQAQIANSRTSLASSMTTEMSHTSSSLSSISSHGSSAAEYEAKESTQALIQALSNQTTPLSAKPRHKYDVRPKVSIPTDIAASEYARQCIAAAESSRLNPYALHPEEYELLRTHLSLLQVTTYLNIRNGILRLWIRNPLIGVMRDEAIGVARDIRWFDVAAVCYEWLVRKGYINFGCLENIPRSVPHTKRSGKRKRKTVAVIGAGMAGLGCARQLEGLFAHFEERFREQGEDAPNVIVLEGRDRVGGRVYSRGLKSDTTASTLTDGNRCTAEMGGMIITGFDRGNPLNILVRGQLALSYHALRPTTTLYDSNGQAVDHTRDQLAEKLYNDILDRVSDYKFKLPPPLNIEGDKDLIDNCRDIHGDGGRPMSASENIDTPQTPNGTSTNPSNTVVPKVEVVPVSSDRLTGKSHLEPGIPAIHKAAYKARLMGWSLKEGVDDSVDLDLDAAVEGNGSTLGSVMDAAISQYRDVVHIMPLDLRLLNWHIANLEYSNAINYNELSLGGWDVDAGNEWEGKHTQIVGGYQQVPRGLLHCPQPLNVRKKSAVRRIIYSSYDALGSAKIECEDGSHVDADVVVSTIPLGVLKSNNVIFEPELPDWKTGAIERLGFGILNKVVLIYKKPFWDQSRDIFGVLRDPLHPGSLNQKDYTTKRGRFFQWFNCTKTSGVPTLIALMAGDAAFQTEGDSNHSLVAEATQVLRNVFGETVPEPVEAIITRWGSDKFARGSYSFTGPNFQPDDYEVMAKSIGNLFFAGEHTCGTHPATVHGAYISGLRAASEVLEAMVGPIEIPDPLLLPKETAKDLKRKASEELRNAAPKDLTQVRLEAYENEIWTAIYAKFGDYPILPPKPNSNPYILFGKDNFENAREKCEEGRRPGKGRSGPNDVRVMLSKMWKEASEEEKQPHQERAKEAKSAYAAALANYTELAKKWNVESLEFRRQYEAEHPSIPSNEELAMQKESLPYKKDRRAKRVSGYAEDSPSDIDV